MFNIQEHRENLKNIQNTIKEISVSLWHRYTEKRRYWFERKNK